MLHHNEKCINIQHTKIKINLISLLIIRVSLLKRKQQQNSVQNEAFNKRKEKKQLKFIRKVNKQ